MTPEEEAARLEAYAARHPADGGRVPPPPPTPIGRLRRRLSSVRRDVLQAGQRGFWSAVRLVPPEVREHPAAAPAKEVVRWVRRRLRQGPPAVERFADGIPPAAAADTLRRAAFAAHAHSAPEVAGVDRPRVAAIVLSRNGAHHLRALFGSIEAHVRYPQLEIWLVDHGSTDDTRAVFEAFERKLALRAISLRAIWMPDNRSFSESTNRAARQTDAPLLLLLNNDIIFTEDVLPPMVAALESSKIGMVGLPLHYPRAHAAMPSGLQHGGIKLYGDGELPFLRPYNLSGLQGLTSAGPRQKSVEPMPAVTAACALVRRAQFLELGGLDEVFEYGYEDIDLSLRLRRQLGLESVVHHAVSAVHDESATQNRDPGPELRARRDANRRALLARHGRFLTQAFLRDKRTAGRYWSDEPLVVAFAVSETGPEARAGDLFTASELAEAMEAAFGWRTVLKPKANGEWYDLEGVDVVVGLVHGYDPRAIHHARPHLLKVGWVRNWFARWPENAGFAHYDLVLASSHAGAEYLAKAHGRRAVVVPIATNPARFADGAASDAHAADVAFTGSRWGVKRDIETNLDPEELHGTVALYGAGWDEHHRFGRWARGFVPYAQMKDVYASTRIVVDDCISVARPWGSLNSRVFDALAAGALVVTNCAIGSDEQFGGELPTYDSAATLTEVVNRYLDDEPARVARVARLRARVLDQHTYAHRAASFAQALASFEGRPASEPRVSVEPARRRVAIKIAVPNPQEAKSWGDYHFAKAIRKCLHREGHAARIDLLPDWYTPASAFDDVVIVLRGLNRFQPSPHQATVMWNISHPEAVLDEEYEAHDAVFVASESFARGLQARMRTPVAALLQCTDPDRFTPDRSGPHHEVLFVGNSRRLRRPIVMDAIAADLPLSVYGRLWGGIIDPRYLRAELVPNEVLPTYYGGASVVLSDHWPDMRALGFLSNRLFDVAACGVPLLTDPVVGLHAVFGDAVKTYVTVDEMRSIMATHRQNPRPWQEAAEALSARVRAEHTFENRTQALMAAAELSLAAKN